MTIDPDYLPERHFWFVGGDRTRVWAATAGDYIPVKAPAFQMFLHAGKVASSIGSEADLFDVLVQAGLDDLAAAAFPAQVEQGARSEKRRIADVEERIGDLGARLDALEGGRG